MNYKYEVILDKERDNWNWLDASRNPHFQGCDWSNYLCGQDLTFFKHVIDLSAQEAKEEIKNHLDKKYKINQDLFERQRKQIEKSISNSFISACEWVKKTTGKPLFFRAYKIYLTTFPRSPYDAEKGSFFINIYKKDGIINVFLHENLHFQFINYWRNDKTSPVSQMSEDNFETLKEALTVIIDGDAVPPADYPEEGYIKKHEKIRKLLHDEWLKSHSFETLIGYGVNLLH